MTVSDPQNIVRAQQQAVVNPLQESERIKYCLHAYAAASTSWTHSFIGSETVELTVLLEDFRGQDDGRSYLHAAVIQPKHLEK